MSFRKQIYPEDVNLILDSFIITRKGIIFLSLRTNEIILCVNKKGT